MTFDEIKRAITKALSLYAGATASQARGLVPTRSLTTGKLYEAYVLAIVAERLATGEGLTLRLSAGSIVRLKSSPGPINRAYPSIDVYRSTDKVAEIWTDVEFLTLSSDVMNSKMPTPGEYHELDIVMVDLGINGRPRHDSIWLGVECKHTAYTKSLLKEILGVRRELSYLRDSEPTRFASWPRDNVSAKPASCLLVFSTDVRVAQYSASGKVFGIDFVYAPL